MREGLSQLEHEVFAFILTVTGDPGPPTRAEIIRKTNRSKAGVQDALRRLEERGMISQAHKGGAWMPRRLVNSVPVRVQVVIGEDTRPGDLIPAQDIFKQGKLGVSLDDDEESREVERVAMQTKSMQKFVGQTIIVGVRGDTSYKIKVIDVQDGQLVGWPKDEASGRGAIPIALDDISWITTS